VACMNAGSRAPPQVGLGGVSRICGLKRKPRRAGAKAKQSRGSSLDRSILSHIRNHARRGPRNGDDARAFTAPQLQTCGRWHTFRRF
jgi:hypothetical protein